MSTMFKTIYQAIAFLLEIAMLISYGYYGMSRRWNFLPRLLFTITLVAIVITLWAIFAAPKSTRRLDMPYLAIFSVSIFLIAAFLLFQSGQKNYAIILAGLAMAIQTIAYLTEK
jgi:hypothetical protein